MKVAFINQPFDEVYGDNRNSIALWTYRAARELNNDHDVSIFCRYFGEANPVIKAGLTFHGFDVSADDKAFRYLRFLKLWFRKKRALFASRWYYAGYYGAIVEAIGREAFDVVHIHNFHQVVPLVRRVSPKSKIVLHMHCDWLVQLHRPWIESTLAKVDLVLGCSDHVTEGIKRKFPRFAGKCQRLYNGFDTERFQPSPREPTPPDLEAPYLLYLGRGSPEKGLHLATRAFSQIASNYPNLKLLCVGGVNPAQKAFLYDLVDKDVRRDMAPCFNGPYVDYVFLGIPGEIMDRIRVIAHIDYDKLVSVYQNAKLLMVPTVCHEAFGMPVLEAIACGTPIVASRCGGIPEFFRDGIDGWLFERGNLDSLVEKLGGLLQTPVPLRSDEDWQRSLIPFSWKSIVSELSNHYNTLI